MQLGLNLAQRIQGSVTEQRFGTKIDVLAHSCKLSEHPDPTFRTGKGISIITELDRLEGVFIAISEVPKLPEDLLVIDTCEANLSTSRIAVAASKWARFSDWDKHSLLLDGEQDGSLHRKFSPGS